MVKKFFNYLLLFFFSFLFSSALWGNHIHHGYYTSIYACTGYEKNSDVSDTRACFNFGEAESFLEHLFEKGIVNENPKFNSLIKIKKVPNKNPALLAKPYRTDAEKYEACLFTEIGIPEKPIIVKSTSPRSPPF